MATWGERLADVGSASSVPRHPGAPPIDTIDGIECRIGGHRCLLVWCDFEVAAGTLSRAAADRFVEVASHATEFGLPMVAIANSGGVRMQEGPRAFVRMADLVGAVRRHRDAGLPVVVYLADPTTGGVLASWGSLGHVTAAEPGALIGFTGPRIAEGLGVPIEPPEVQRAEGLLSRGQIDALVGRDDLSGWIGEVLNVLAPDAPTPVGGVPPVHGPTGWAAVEATRVRNREPAIEALIAELRRRSAVVELSGDRSGHRDPAVWCAFGRLAGHRVAVIAHRGHGHRPARPAAAGLRTARRVMVIADELGIAVVTMIDTPGPVIDGVQEAEGFAGEVARSLDAMARLRVPSVAVLAGQGGGGPALAWFAASVRLALPDAWLAPISPEAGSLIVHRDTDHAAELADLQEVSATELCRDGVIHRVVDVDHLADAIVAALGERG